MDHLKQPNNTPQTVAIPPHFSRALANTFQRKNLDLHGTLAIINGSAAQHDIKNNETDKCFSFVEFARLLQTAWWLLDDENLGLGDAPPLKPGAFFYASNLMINAPNLGEALHVACGFYSYITVSWRPSLEQTHSQARFKVKRAGRKNDPDNFLADMILVAFHNFASWLIGERIALNRVEFDFPAPDHEPDYHFLFPCERRFQQEELELCFSSTYLKKEIIQTASDLEALLWASPSFMLEPKEENLSLQHRVRSMLESLDPLAPPTISALAAQMNTSAKTLRQRLRIEGISYQQLKDSARRDRAIHYLCHHQVSIAEVAYRVGFQETGAFSKAFKNWTGESPANYRKRMVS